MESHPDIAPDIVRRINEAADQLYEQTGRSGFPNVDAVRRRARANMNHASLVMRDWRRRHATSTAVLEDALPAGLESASRQLVNAFWREASALGNAHLQTAQNGWEQERRELEEFRDQIAAAFDVQAGELAAAYNASATLRSETDAHTERIAVLSRRAIDAEAKANSTDTALMHAKTQMQEMHESLRQTQAAQQQLAQQLQEQHMAASTVAERNLAEQTRYAEQLGQARQEATDLRAQLADATPKRPGRRQHANNIVGIPGMGARKETPP